MDAEAVAEVARGAQAAARTAVDASRSAHAAAPVISDVRPWTTKPPRRSSTKTTTAVQTPRSLWPEHFAGFSPCNVDRPTTHFVMVGRQTHGAKDGPSSNTAVIYMVMLGSLFLYIGICTTGIFMDSERRACPLPLPLWRGIRSHAAAHLHEGLLLGVHTQHDKKMGRRLKEQKVEPRLTFIFFCSLSGGL